MICETGLWRFIDRRIRNMGLAAGEAVPEYFIAVIGSYHQIIELGQDTAVLVNLKLDIPYTAQLILDSGNNKFETSKLDYEHLTYARHQFFQDQINVTTNNYGIDFIAYQLEFIRISPNKPVLNN
jgi:hypothetical protein